ncbi:MAG: glycosyltransferase family 39 protein [Verrucomicrobiae bacterium]
MLAALGVLSLCWVLLYLPNLRTSPGWYGDETLTFCSSRDLASGVASNFALWNTYWHPHYPYQPAYSLVNGIFARLAHGDIVGSRFFNALLALAAAFSIYLIGRYRFGSRASLFAAAMFLVYGQTIIHYRMGNSHNAAGLGLLIMTLFLLRKPRMGNDWFAGLGLMVGAGAHPLFVHGAVAGILCRLKHPVSWVRILLPCVLYLAVSLAVIYHFFGRWLVEDLVHLQEAFSARGQADGGGRAFENFRIFISQDWFHLGLLGGLLLCFPLRRTAAPIVGLLVLFLLVRNRQNLVVFYYQAIVILPVLCLGWAGLWRYCETRIRRLAPRVRHIVLALGALPLTLFAVALPASLAGTLTPRNHYWVTQSPAEVEAAAQWLNERTGPGDVVAGNPNIAWLLHARTVPYLQMITWYGIPTQGYENGNARERFRFDSSLENARFAVIGDIDRRWTFGEPNVIRLAERMESEKWPVVWRGPNYEILANPRFPAGD